MTSAISTSGLGKRYGSTWALSDCSLEIPSGSVTALVGPNGAGKTTLLQLAVGLSRPSAGSVSVLGHSPLTDARSLLPRVGFVAQEHPLYRGFTVSDTLKLGRKLNPSWDEGVALARIEHLGLPLGQKVGTLSGGQQAQVALTLALAKRPEVLLLDEPVAALDPLARRDFLRSLMEAVAETGLTVVLSSHIVAELERVCDHIVILAEGGVRLDGAIDEILASHQLLTGPRNEQVPVASSHVVEASTTDRQATLLVRSTVQPIEPNWRSDDGSREEIVLAYLGRREPPRPLQPVRAVAS